MKKAMIVAALIVAAAVLAAGAVGAGKYLITSGSQIADGVIPASKLTDGARKSLSGDQGDRGPKGAKGERGERGAQGPQGDRGAQGAVGPQGPKGDKGDTGAQGPAGPQGAAGAQGPQGPAGAAASSDYGIAGVRVKRGPNTAQWATYSTLLGNPVVVSGQPAGDTTGGTFRFTCNASQAPCEVSVVAAAFASGQVAVYPRVLIYKGGTPSSSLQPETYCEYGDGSTGSAPLALTGQSPTSSPTWTDVPVNIGGSADCGIAGPAGDVASIVVPEGYYDVKATFVFHK